MRNGFRVWTDRIIPLRRRANHFGSKIEIGRTLVSLTSTAILVPERQTSEGLLVKSYGAAWVAIARELGNDWSIAHQIGPRQWEQILAGALDKEGFQVTLTPQSGDHGVDVIARKGGVGRCVCWAR